MNNRNKAITISALIWIFVAIVITLMFLFQPVAIFFAYALGIVSLSVMVWFIYHIILTELEDYSEEM